MDESRITVILLSDCNIESQLKPLEFIFFEKKNEKLKHELTNDKENVKITENTF